MGAELMPRPPMFADLGPEQVRDSLLEVRREISRVNRAAGMTVFNPAATEALQSLLDDLLADEGAEVAEDIAAGRY